MREQGLRALGCHLGSEIVNLSVVKGTPAK
jgi:hypothetical protein